MAQPEVWDVLRGKLTAFVAESGRPAHWDLRGLDRLDHTGAQLLWNAWGRAWPAEVQAHSALA